MVVRQPLSHSLRCVRTWRMRLRRVNLWCVSRGRRGGSSGAPAPRPPRLGEQRSPLPARKPSRPARDPSLPHQHSTLRKPGYDPRSRRPVRRWTATPRQPTTRPKIPWARQPGASSQRHTPLPARSASGSSATPAAPARPAFTTLARCRVFRRRRRCRRSWARTMFGLHSFPDEDSVPEKGGGVTSHHSAPGSPSSPTTTTSLSSRWRANDVPLPQQRNREGAREKASNSPVADRTVSRWAQHRPRLLDVLGLVDHLPP